MNSFNQFSNGILSLKQETIKCPALGDSLPEGQLESFVFMFFSVLLLMIANIQNSQKNRWLKKEGDFVAEDDVVAQVATDKVTVDIRSPFSGKVLKILVETGKNV